MKTARLMMLFGSVGIGLIAVRLMLSARIASAQVDPDTLPPCGAYEELRALQTPMPVTPAATNTPDAAAPTPTTPPPTATPRPAPTEDRVGFPENYATEFKLLLIYDRPDNRWVRIICGNEIAAAHQPGEPYAYGSVLLMITYAARIGEDRQPVLDENGHYIRERLVAMHVQRKEEGFGEAYGEDRAGEWEFVAYNGDGSYLARPETTNNCAACHLRQAGESVDFVFRTTLFAQDESVLVSPPVGENEVSIFLFDFHEPVLEISAGTTVTWINNDEATHQITAADVNAEGRTVPAEDPLFASDVLASVSIAPGSSFSHTFTEPGEYLYMCSIHPGMTARIIVTE